MYTFVLLPSIKICNHNSKIDSFDEAVLGTSHPFPFNSQYLEIHPFIVPKLYLELRDNK